MQQQENNYDVSHTHVIERERESMNLTILKIFQKQSKKEKD